MGRPGVGLTASGLGVEGAIHALKRLIAGGLSIGSS